MKAAEAAEAGEGKFMSEQIFLLFKIYDWLFFRRQTYYIEYYARYLESYERHQQQLQQQQQQQGQQQQPSSNDAVVPLEASLFMDDIMNNGMTLCAIM